VLCCDKVKWCIATAPSSVSLSAERLSFAPDHQDKLKWQRRCADAAEVYATQLSAPWRS
jgi:hypothetical protein